MNIYHPLFIRRSLFAISMLLSHIKSICEVCSDIVGYEKQQDGFNLVCYRPKSRNHKHTGIYRMSGYDSMSEMDCVFYLIMKYFVGRIGNISIKTLWPYWMK